MSTIKPLSNVVSLTSGDNVWLATAVLVTSNTAGVTVTVANVAAPTDTGQHGNYAGGQVQLHIAPNTQTVVRKRPQDTVTAANCLGCKVADSGT